VLVVVGVVVLLALVAGGAVLLLGSGSSPTVAIDRCEIAADGTLTASGTLEGGDRDTEVEVVFRDVATDAVVDDEDTDVPGGEGSWRATGRAGPDVRRVTCVATVDG
jgi:hypothetical protein